MKLEDALFNWLQISVVADARPDDRSAVETASFFYQILTEDHQVRELAYSRDEMIYTLTYTTVQDCRQQRYDREAVEQLLSAINAEPKYNQ